MLKMRAKMQVGFVQDFTRCPRWQTPYEVLHMHAVSATNYSEDGSDEDNTYAKFSPGANLQINIANPAMFGQFKVGEKYYIDFTLADAE